MKNDLISALAVAKEAGVYLAEDAPLQPNVGNVLTCKMPDHTQRTYEIVRRGLARDVLLRRLT